MVSFLKKNLLIFFLIFFVGQNAHSLNFKDGEKAMDCDDFISEQAKSMASKNEQINEGNAYYNCREDNSLIDYYFKIGNEKDNYEGAKFDYMGAGIGIVEECLSDDIELLNAWSNLEEIFYLLNYEFGARLSKGKNGTRRWLDCEKNYVMDVKEIKNEITGIANFIKQKYGEKELVNVLDFLDEQIVLKSNNSQNNFEFYTNLFNEIRADQNLTNIKIEEKKEKEDKEPEKLEQKNDSFDVLAELSKNELILLQENLKLLEFYQGSIDGIFGQNTLNALKKWIKSKEYADIYKKEYLKEIAKEAEQSEIAIKKREEEERNRKLLEENNRNDLLNEIDQLNQSIQELKNKILSINPYSDLLSNNKVSSNNLEEKVISENANNKSSGKEELTLPSENIETISSSKKFIANIQQNNICVGNICLYDTLDDVMKFRSEPANCDYASTEKLCLGEQCISKNEIDTKDAFEDEYWCRDPSRFKKSSEINADLALYFEAEQSVYDALSQDDYDTNVWTFQLSENSYKNLNKVKSWCTYAPRLLGIFNTESGNNISLYLLPDEEFEYYVAGIEVIYNNFLNSKNEYSLTHQIDIYNAIVKKYKKVLGTNVKYTNRIDQTLDYNGLYPLYEKYGTQIEASPTIKGNKTYFFLDSGYSPGQQEPIYLSVYNEILEYTRNWNPDNEINYLFNVSANQGESEYCKNLSSGEINID